LGPQLLSDPDTYSHIALGRWIFEHHTVPTHLPTKRMGMSMRLGAWSTAFHLSSAAAPSFTVRPISSVTTVR
jgi:hypothetical protein